MIIILSGADDPTADRVEFELDRRSARYSRLDLSDFPQRVTASACLDDAGRWTGQIRHDDGWSVAWEDIEAVYYRRPSNFRPASSLTANERRFVVAEARGGFGGVLASLNARWVNHPFRIADSEFKPVQLTAAREYGFTVPSTLITNDGSSAHGFARTWPQKIVYKPLGGGFHRDDHDNLTLIYATLVAAESFDDAEIATTSHSFQSFIEKSHDVRVTVAGSRVFGAAIHSTSDAGRVDWRSDYDSLSYAEIAIPGEIADAIYRYLSRFDILYGAFDFSVDQEGRWWFLECNPNGQWGFIAEATGMPIASAIADLLIGDVV
ncbi:MAG: ATP-grasp ribosomal peptide maturase, partial [Pseudonocardiaceae bacterium]